MLSPRAPTHRQLHMANPVHVISQETLLAWGSAIFYRQRCCLFLNNKDQFTTLCEARASVTSVLCLAPMNLRRNFSRRVSCYALFKGWLLLSQPPRCFRNTTAFHT